MNDNIKQSHINTLGDVIAGDKYIIMRKEIAKANSTLRSELSFNIECDEVHTTLTKKLKDGKFNSVSRNNALSFKVKTIRLLLKMCDKESGKAAVADIYDNLINVIDNKFISKLDDGDLLKTKLSEIHDELVLIVKKYENIINIDEAFLKGLLYVATSNCAIRWLIEEDI